VEVTDGAAYRPSSRSASSMSPASPRCGTRGPSVEPVQLAALLLEKKAEEPSEGAAESLVRPKDVPAGDPSRRNASRDGRAAVVQSATGTGDARELRHNLASRIIVARRSNSPHLHCRGSPAKSMTCPNRPKAREAQTHHGLTNEMALFACYRRQFRRRATRHPHCDNAQLQ
jgi:hypothetical protein